MRVIKPTFFLVLALPAALFAQAQKPLMPEDLFRRNVGTKEQQNKQFPPHKIVGNLYYVGTESLASFLIVTPEGNILINSAYEATVPVIRDSVEKLGFHFADIKILLGSHAHAVGTQSVGATSVLAGKLARHNRRPPSSAAQVAGFQERTTRCHENPHAN